MGRLWLNSSTESRWEHSLCTLPRDVYNGEHLALGTRMDHTHHNVIICPDASTFAPAVPHAYGTTQSSMPEGHMVLSGACASTVPTLTSRGLYAVLGGERNAQYFAHQRGAMGDHLSRADPFLYRAIAAMAAGAGRPARIPAGGHGTGAQRRHGGAAVHVALGFFAGDGPVPR